MWTSESSEFGTVRMVRSSVRIRVERRPTSSTTPWLSPTRHMSPTRIG